MRSFSEIFAQRVTWLLENLHRFSRKSQRTRTRAWQKLHVQNDPNWAEFIIDASVRTCVRAFNASLRGACTAIILRASRKNITIQLHLARRKMIRIIQVHLHFYPSFGATISYDVTHAWLRGGKRIHNLEIRSLLRNILLTKTIAKALSKCISEILSTMKIFTGQKGRDHDLFSIVKFVLIIMKYYNRTTVII